MSDSPDQSQSQSQALNLTLNLGKNSGDPELERQVFNELYSAGSQIGRIAEVVAVLIQALDGSPALQLPEARAALDAFREMQTEIGRLKAEHAPERRLIAELDALKQRDQPGYDRAREALRVYLAG